MEKEPHYAKYSLAELLEVQENIDSEKYPNRAAKVDAEIQKRKEKGETVEPSFTRDFDDDEESYELILDFEGEEQQTLRWLFLTAVVAVHILGFAWVWHKVSVPEMSELPEYLINVEAVQCKTMGHHKNRYYDLVIKSWGYSFYAVDIRRSLCNRLAKTIPKEADVRIWHLDGIIFHMTLEDKILLSHQYLRSHYRWNRLGGYHIWFIWALILWATLFKSIANAISPGTFIKE